MYEDFRKQSDEDAFEDELEDELDADLFVSEQHANFLGMTDVQRFVIALILLVMTIILGSFCLLVTEKVVLPIG